MNQQDKIWVHFICENKIIRRDILSHIPLIGDEIRMGGIGQEKFFKVTKRVWAYDEDNISYSRLNVELQEVE